MRIGAGQNSNNSLCDASLSFVAQDNVDLSRFGTLTFDWTVVGSMTYTASSADIVFRVGLQNTGDLWTKTFSPPTSSGTADLNQHGTETITIPKGAPVGEFSIDVQYVGAVGVTEAQCVIAYVDNFQVK